MWSLLVYFRGRGVEANAGEGEATAVAYLMYKRCVRMESKGCDPGIGHELGLGMTECRFGVWVNLNVKRSAWWYEGAVNDKSSHTLGRRLLLGHGNECLSLVRDSEDDRSAFDNGGE